MRCRGKLVDDFTVYTLLTPYPFCTYPGPGSCSPLTLLFRDAHFLATQFVGPRIQADALPVLVETIPSIGLEKLLSQIKDSLRGLQVGLNEPEPAIGATRDLGEEVGAVSIKQVRRLPDRVADMLAEAGECRCQRLDVAVPVSDCERIPVERRSPTDQVYRPFGTASSP